MVSKTFSPEDLPSRFDFVEAQSRIYDLWKTKGYFHSEPDPDRKPFTIVIPPPNVTGALHLGHALNNTLQDVVIRFKRMQGFNTLWMPGTDHAGIATQAVVERRILQQEGKSRHDLGREKLVARIWEWKEEYEARILGQLQQIGSSCDWDRVRFTLDDQCARAVRRTFFDLFKQDLIYRGKRLVNWDTFLQTAVSDDEVFHETVKGHFWHFKYPVIHPKSGEPPFVHVATTRPETMLGDTAVAVHPDPAKALDKVEAELKEKLAASSDKDRAPIEQQLEDLAKRRTELLPTLELLRDMAADGRMVRLPLMDREIPLVADEWAKPELGSGCVKITPAHDPNDYEVGKRGDLPMINILNPDGTLNANAGEYQGLTLKQARKKVVEDLDALGLLDEIEDREIELGKSDRSKTPIEPYLADQWFVRMDQLAQSAMDAVSDGRVKIYPTRYAKGYHDWLAEKRDWPVSRQLWWGHQIPIWSIDCATQQDCDAATEKLNALPAAKDGQIAVSVEQREDGTQTVHVCVEDADADIESAIEALGLTREADVLDTWFSSALWPHSTLGWPEKTPELAYYYPTSTLITSRDIITLWVARMVLAGLNNMGEIPFDEVFIHPKILDGYGETMSKSKGNGVDPLDVIQKFGADALRFCLTHITTDTQDVRLPVQFECPHCNSLMDQTKKNRELPVVECKKCAKKFSTQWARSEEDKAHPRGPAVSEKFEQARNFSNKLWNASRFSLINLADFEPGTVTDEDLETEDRWLLSRLSTVNEQVTECFGTYKYAEAARTLYHFAWNEFCSFYIEMTKDRMNDPQQRQVAQRVLAHTLDNLLRLLHPIIPFITEEVWGLLNQAAPQRGLAQLDTPSEHLIVAGWPEFNKDHQEPEIEQRFAQFQSLLGALREIRNSKQIPPKQSIEFSVRCDDDKTQLLQPMDPYFASMAGATNVGWGPSVEAPKTAARVNVSGMEVYVDLKDFIDVDAEIKRNEKQLTKLMGMITGKEKKLENASFVDRAPAEIVQREKDSLVELKEQLKTVEEALVELRKS